MKEVRIMVCNVFREWIGSLNEPLSRHTLVRQFAPLCGWPRLHRQPDMMPYLNTKLLEKFQNVKSPVHSLLASPGMFDSPTV